MRVELAVGTVDMRVLILIESFYDDLKACLPAGQAGESACGNNFQAYQNRGAGKFKIACNIKSF